MGLPIVRTVIWRSGETAPKDGEWFSSCHEEFDKETKYRRYDLTVGDFVDMNTHLDNYFTHWTRDRVTP